MNSVIWISHDDKGATFVQAPCDDLLKSRSMPASTTKSPT